MSGREPPRSTRIDLIHLSDLHFRGRLDEMIKFIPQLAAALVNEIAGGHPIFLVITGDIAFSGAAAEYDAARVAIEHLRDRLRSDPRVGPLTILLVPGNHDCNFKLDTAARRSAIESLGTASHYWDPSIPAIALRVQQEFRDFQQSLGCAFTPTGTSGLLHRLEFVGSTPRVVLVSANSAWMSVLHENPGRLWFPVEELAQTLESESPALLIVLIHHPPPWFQPEIRRELVGLLNRTASIVLSGHEHHSHSSERIDESGSALLFFEGGLLQQDGVVPQGSSFNLISINLALSQVTRRSFALSGKPYVAGSPGVWQLNASRLVTTPPRLLRDGQLHALKQIDPALRHPRKVLLELDDLYVAPALIERDTLDGPHGRVGSDELLSRIHQTPLVVFAGPDKAGKTTLLRRAYLQLHSQGFTPVAIDGKSFRRVDPSGWTEMIDREYLRQYAATDVVAWSQLHWKERVLLIDDYDEVPLKRQSR
jgi:hypothetical protein